jgi:hypothetical protein
MQSEVVVSRGKHIVVEAYKGKKQMDQFLTLKWPWQPVITTKQQNLWKTALEVVLHLQDEL